MTTKEFYKKIGSTPSFHVKYDAKEDNYPAIDEDRPLDAWNFSMDKLWPLKNYKTPMAGQERTHPLEEVRVVSWIRAVYS